MGLLLFFFFVFFFFIELALAVSDDRIPSTNLTVYGFGSRGSCVSAASIIDQCQDHAGSETRESECVSERESIQT